MSASSKKKIRKEQNATALTEKQNQARAEAKKLKITSVLFAVLMIAILVTGLTVMVIRGVQGSGMIEKNTVSLTVGDHKINSIHMNYYYIDTVSSTYEQWSNSYGDYADAYLAMMALDVTLPLDEQPYTDGEGTWADYFMDIAAERAAADYIVYDMAMAEGFTLTAEQELNLDSNVNYKDLYAMYNGYSDVDDYMVAVYGPGSSRDSYYEYAKVSAIASAYYNHYSDNLSYTDEDLRAHEEGNELNYNSYTYASYYLGYSKYLDEGVTDPSAELIEAGAQKAKLDAELLVKSTSVEELDAAIAGLAVNAESASAASTKYEHTLYPSVNSVVRDWIADENRKAGDITMIANEVESTDEEGNTTSAVNGYYVIFFQDANDNTEPMANVRHLLVKYEGGTTDEDGNTTYTDEEKAAAKAEAEEHLNTWKNGEATEESFIALVQEFSQDGSATEGGLFEDVNPGSNFVPSFLNWSIDPAREVGDTDIVESVHGYHVMYYSSDDELSYRDYLITEELREADLAAWYDAAISSVAAERGDLSKIETGLILSSAS